MGRFVTLCGRCFSRGFGSVFIKIDDGGALLSSFGALLGALGTLSILVVLYILAKLSERFGSVIKMAPLYRYYYLAILFLAIGSITQLFVVRATLTDEYSQVWFTTPWFLFLAYHLPLAVGVTIALVIAWRYWSWLITERNG